MTGYINASLEAVIPLRLFGGGMAFREVEAVIDTGFNGALALPPDMIESLSLPLHQPKRFVLGDGSERSLKQYYAEMAWDGKVYKVVVTSVSGTPPLIGTALLKGRNLNADWFVGGRVSLMPAAP